MQNVRGARRAALFLLDLIGSAVAFFAAVALYPVGRPAGVLLAEHWVGALWYVGTYLLVFEGFGRSDSLWRYAQFEEFAGCALASLLAAGCGAAAAWLLGTTQLPAAFYLTVVLLTTALGVGGRMCYRRLRTRRGRAARGAQRIVLVGAGEGGCSFLYELQKSPARGQVVCVVDDDPQKQGRHLRGVPIEGPLEELPRLAERYRADEIVIAIPSATEQELARIYRHCAAARLPVRRLPHLYELLCTGGSIAERVRAVSPEELLGREPVQLCDDSGRMLEGRTVLVTGCGSIGAEIARQVAACRPQRLVLVDIYENNLYDLQQELRQTWGDALQVCPVVASVRDEAKLRRVFAAHRPQVVFHSAAHKHVPLMEENIDEAVKNNVFGTLNTVSCAADNSCERFVLISTDKAVDPTSIMGATKQICEQIVQYFAACRLHTRFAVVRFGNVLGSNGSVIPLFKRQIAAGGPVTLTHPDMIRYFMTIPEAVQLVLRAAVQAEGGEVFVLDMGRPVKIRTLAEDLIRLSGLVPGRDIQIEVTGLRPGEKLEEALWQQEEQPQPTADTRIFTVRPRPVDEDELLRGLTVLRRAARNGDIRALIDTLQRMVYGPPLPRPGMGNDQRHAPAG